MTDIDFRDTLLALRDKISHAEHWWKQGNEEKAKEALQRLADTSKDAAEYHFEEIKTFYEGDKDLEDIIEHKKEEENQ